MIKNYCPEFTIPISVVASALLLIISIFVVKDIFEEIQNIAGIPIDHSFLKYKKELLEYGYSVEKISMKKQTVTFCQVQGLKREDTAQG